MNSNGGRDEKTGRFVRGNKVALKHGAFAFKVTGVVPSLRGARKLRDELTRVRRELEKNCPEMNVKKELLIDQVISATGFLKLFEGYVRKTGMIDPNAWKKAALNWQPGFSIYLSMMRQQQSALLSLGLDSEKAEEVLAPYQIIEADKEEKGNEHNSSD